MKDFIMDISPDNKKYFCHINDSCIETYFKNFSMKTTWNLLFARIFNLEYVDFLRMVRDIYGATLSGKQGGYISFYFTEKQMCQKFINDLSKRFNLWKKI